MPRGVYGNQEESGHHSRDQIVMFPQHFKDRVLGVHSVLGLSTPFCFLFQALFAVIESIVSLKVKVYIIGLIRTPVKIEQSIQPDSPTAM